MASPFSYQMPSWHEDAPFPIEGNIVNNLASAPWTSGTQLPLLAMYMAQRSAGQRGYQDELAQQHEFAAQALASHNAHETQANALKMLELKNPGALRYAAANPNLAGLVAGTDPTAAANYADQADRAYTAGIMKDVGQGQQGFAMSGMRAPMADASSLTHLNMEPVDPAIVQAAAIRAASGGGGGGDGMKWELSTVPDHPEIAPQLKMRGKGQLPPNLLPPAPTFKRPTRPGSIGGQ